MNLMFAEEAGKTFLWILTLGKSELRAVRTDVEELINDLRKSLVSLYDLAKVITDIDAANLDTRTFAPVYDYVDRFYLNPQDLSAARTHCGYVSRDVDRIMFKLGKLLHSDVGKWKEAQQQLVAVIGADGAILDSLDSTVTDIRAKLDAVNTHLMAGNVPAARNFYSQLSATLKPDVVALGKYVDAMDRANRHLWSVTA
jgi:hypothetical protein